MVAGERAQSIARSSGVNEDESKPQRPCIDPGMVGMSCNLALGKRDRWIYRTFWPASLACTVSPTAVRDPISKNRTARGVTPPSGLPSPCGPGACTQVQSVHAYTELQTLR